MANSVSIACAIIAMWGGGKLYAYIYSVGMSDRRATSIMTVIYAFMLASAMATMTVMLQLIS